MSNWVRFLPFLFAYSYHLLNKFYVYLCFLYEEPNPLLLPKRKFKWGSKLALKCAKTNIHTNRCPPSSSTVKLRLLALDFIALRRRLQAEDPRHDDEILILKPKRAVLCCWYCCKWHCHLLRGCFRLNFFPLTDQAFPLPFIARLFILAQLPNALELRTCHVTWHNYRFIVMESYIKNSGTQIWLSQSFKQR